MKIGSQPRQYILFFFPSFRFKIPNTLPGYIDIVFEVFIYFMSQMFSGYCIPIPGLLLERVIYSDRVSGFDERADISECTRIYHRPIQANKKVLFSPSSRLPARRYIKSSPCFPALSGRYQRYWLEKEDERSPARYGSETSSEKCVRRHFSLRVFTIFTNVELAGTLTGRT